MKKTDIKKMFFGFIILSFIIFFIMKINVPDETKAILISILSVIYGFAKDFIDSYKNQKYNKKNFMAEFFRELYFKKIVTDIPSLLLKYTTANDGQKSNVLAELDILIVELLDSSMFYKYHDDKFYVKIKEAVINIQDNIFQVRESIANNLYRIEVTDQKLNENFSNLYDIMIEYYIDGR